MCACVCVCACLAACCLTDFVKNTVILYFLPVLFSSQFIAETERTQTGNLLDLLLFHSQVWWATLQSVVICARLTSHLHPTITSRPHCKYNLSLSLSLSFSVYIYIYSKTHSATSFQFYLSSYIYIYIYIYRLFIMAHLVRAQGVYNTDVHMHHFQKHRHMNLCTRAHNCMHMSIPPTHTRTHTHTFMYTHMLQIHVCIASHGLVGKSDKSVSRREECVFFSSGLT